MSPDARLIVLDMGRWVILLFEFRGAPGKEDKPAAQYVLGVHCQVIAAYLPIAAGRREMDATGPKLVYCG